MMQTSLSARSALLAQQRQLDVIANNISNVNTVGFKSSSVNFKDTLYSTLTRPVEPQNNSLHAGTGVRVGSISRNFTAGMVTQTGIPLDFCLMGDGFFNIQNAAGETLYTRAGAFAISSESGGRYLVTSDGSYVMGEGGKIQIPDGDLSTLGINEAGELSLGTNASFAKLKVSTFQNNDGLEAVGGSAFRATTASGEAKDAEKPQIQKGALEASNVDMVTEMTSLIRAQKAFAFASQAVKTADEMAAMANNMRT